VEDFCTRVFTRDKVAGPRGSAVTGSIGEAVGMVESTITAMTNGFVGTCGTGCQRLHHFGSLSCGPARSIVPSLIIKTVQTLKVKNIALLWSKNV
jgi:hypothetical protein